MLHSPVNATGDRLKEMRKEAGYSIDEAVALCNLLSDSFGLPESFSRKSLRRFESIGKTTSYGKTPPSYSELHIIMRVYGGSPGYLIWGLPPRRYPLERYEELSSIYLAPDILEHISFIVGLSLSKRRAFMGLIKELTT
jgi:transcriptional regulator with XRE-family HTH domain